MGGDPRRGYYSSLEQYSGGLDEDLVSTSKEDVEEFELFRCVRYLVSHHLHRLSNSRSLFL